MFTVCITLLVCVWVPDHRVCDLASFGTTVPLLDKKTTYKKKDKDI